MKWAKLVYFGVLGFAGGSIATSYADTKKSVSAAQVNGTWKTTSGEFKSGHWVNSVTLFGPLAGHFFAQQSAVDLSNLPVVGEQASRS